MTAMHDVPGNGNSVIGVTRAIDGVRILLEAPWWVWLALGVCVGLFGVVAWIPFRYRGER